MRGRFEFTKDEAGPSVMSAPNSFHHVMIQTEEAVIAAVVTNVPTTVDPL